MAAATAASAPAAADTAEAFAGSASATALKLSLLGINLTVSKTNASADSSSKAHADATVIGGNLLTLAPTKADAPVAANLSNTTPQACNVSVPIQTILTVSAICSQSAAAVPTAPAPAVCSPGATGVAPTACAHASVLDIDVQLLQVLQPLLTAIANLAQPVSTTIGQVLSNLPVVTPLLNNLLHGPLLGGLNLNLSDPVTSLVAAVQRATELLGIHVLPSVSSVATTTGALTAASESDGLEIDLLPHITLNGGPLLSISVAKGATTATYNRTTCQSTSSFTGAVVAVKVLDTPINIGAGTLTLPLGLGSITLGGGNSSQNPDGSVGAVADGLDINLLGGAIVLDVAHAEAVAGGQCAVTTATTTTAAPVTTTTTVPVVVTGTAPIQLATTGTSAPVLPIGFMLIFAGYLTRRYRTRRARRASAPR